MDLSFTVRTLALAVFPCTSLKGISLVLLVFMWLRHLFFVAAHSGFVLPLEDSILDCFFSLLG